MDDVIGMCAERCPLDDDLRRAAASDPGKVAVIAEGAAHTYSDLLSATHELAVRLQRLGLKHGDRVAVYMENTWPCVVGIYAVLQAGGVLMVLNPQTKIEKLGYVLDDSQARFLLGAEYLVDRYHAALERRRDFTILVASDAAAWKPAGAADATEQTSAGASDAGSPARRGENPHALAPAVPPELAALIYTSGSTGRPKGVMMTHESMAFIVDTVSRYLRLGRHDRILNVLPFAYSYGLYQLLMSVSLGSTLILERSFSYPAQVVERMQTERATVFAGVPTIFSNLIGTSKRTVLRFPSVTRVTNAAAALPVSFVGELQQIFPNALIYQMYGLTECKRATYLEPELVSVKPGSVGKAMPGTEAFVADENGVRKGPGEVGLLYVRGPHVMQGYWNDPVKTAKVVTYGNSPEDRILCTGDLFKMDADGFLYFVSRSDDIINVGGEKVSPVEIENVLYGIDGVREAAVVGVADDTLGESIRAFVALETGSTLTATNIRRVCISKLERSHVPKDVVILSELPRTTTGKIRKKSLRERTHS